MVFFVFWFAIFTTMQTSATLQRIELKQHIDLLHEDDLTKVFRYTRLLLITKHFMVNNTVSKALTAQLGKRDWSTADKTRIDSLFQNKWDNIKEGQKLTRAFIQYFENYADYEGNHFLQRKHADGRTGYAFEDKFALFLKLFLQSRPELYEKNRFPYELKVNEAIAVKGMPTAQKPDIRIEKGGKPLMFLELKKSFSKATLIHTYREQENKWKTFSGASFLFIIFSASPSKGPVYRKHENARIVCTGLRTTSEQKNVRTEPEICCSVESIFEEIVQRLKKNGNRPNSKGTLWDGILQTD